jgi:hypothetical protein
LGYAECEELFSASQIITDETLNDAELRALVGSTLDLSAIRRKSRAGGRGCLRKAGFAFINGHDNRESWLVDSLFGLTVSEKPVSLGAYLMQFGLGNRPGWGRIYLKSAGIDHGNLSTA